MPKHSGLGKGLEALIPIGFQPEVHTAEETAVAAATGGVLSVPVEKIVPNPRQPRSHFDPATLAELAASIKEHGIIQPLLVSRDDVGTGYILVAGERRWQAAKLAGLPEVPVVVRQTTDQQRLELALIENLQRADLNPLEEANAYRQLSDDFHLSHEEIAAKVGKSRVAVTNTMRLLRLPGLVQQALVDGRISEGHARALLALTSEKAMEAALRTVLVQEMTVRQTEELVRKLGGEKPVVQPKPAPSPDVLALEEKIRSSLGTKVSLKTGKKGDGSLTLYFYSEEELNALLGRLIDEQ
ncbi:MAG: ParB/RepB/Spo0J family partition protein [Chloroflexi bacterium]|nr:MAG: ParB/RepB/Spo0J family partition protein [Chloroflexota bacterium]